MIAWTIKALGRVQRQLNPLGLMVPERFQRRLINAVCIGYSGPPHWDFFRRVLSDNSLRDILMLGVYYGRDIAYMQTILGNYSRSNYSIIGVDKFVDSFCNDWPEAVRDLSWEQAGFGPAPILERAHDNLSRLKLLTNVTLKAALAEEFLVEGDEKFDLIYIDTSHDYATTRKHIDLSMERLRPSGIVAGDDFSDAGTWGVQTAVKECFTEFEVLHEWIWMARKEMFRGFLGT